jgi:hypothetical protein
MERARKRSSCVVADYIEHVLSKKKWSQAELARRLEVPVSRINVLVNGTQREGHYGYGYQSVAVPFLFEIEEISGIRLKLAAAKPPNPKAHLRLVQP